jgi:ArsR family transcriptional regulator
LSAADAINIQLAGATRARFLFLTEKSLYRKITIMNTKPTPIRDLTTDEERLMLMMKALGNPIRMQILRYLRENPQCITGDLVDALPIAQATVSQHLKVLREAGWLCGTIEGPAVSYCIDDDNAAWFRSQVDSLF